MFLGLSNWDVTLWLDFFWLWWWNMNVDVFLHNSCTTASAWWVATESTAAATTWNCFIFLKIHSFCYQPNSIRFFGKFLISAVMHLDYLLPMYLWSFRSHGKYIEKKCFCKRREKNGFPPVFIDDTVDWDKIACEKVILAWKLCDYFWFKKFDCVVHLQKMHNICISSWRNCMENTVIKSFSAL